MMKRRYSINECKKIINKIRMISPNVLIRTQIMVGFPTEREEDFLESLNLLDDVVFDYVEAHAYSKRPGTYAALMEPKVPDEIIRSRFYKLYRKTFLNRKSRKIKTLLKCII